MKDESSDKSESESESESDDSGGSYVRLRKFKQRFLRKKREVSRDDLYPAQLHAHHIEGYGNRNDDQLTLSVTNFMVEKEMRAGCITMKCIK